MAVLHYTVGNTVFSQEIVLTHQDKKSFTIFDMMLLVGGPTTPHFNMGLWVFTNSNNMEKKINYNTIGSSALNMDIYGPVVVAFPSELESQFFLPSKESYESAIDYIKTFLEESNLENGLFYEEGLDESEMVGDMDEESLLDGEDMSDIIQNTMDYLYAEIFEGDNEPEMFEFDNAELNEIFANVDLSKSEVQVDILDSMLQYYTEMEEYEKCKMLSNLISHKKRENNPESIN